MVPDRVAASATQRNDPVLARACQAGAYRCFALHGGERPHSASGGVPFGVKPGAT